jgi:protein-serine/threonine kinase
LYNVIKNGHMEKAEIDCCFRQLLSGVEYLHSMGVAHRDLKPENLLLTLEGKLKITDFGVSDVFQVCWERDMHASRGRCGSEPYMAPELFEKRDYDARLVDLWSCGVVYYAMAFKGVMFHRARKDDPYFVAYVEKKQNGTYEPFLTLENGCRELLEGLLEPIASLRWDMAKVTSNAWLNSIVVCENCHTPDGHEHIHFTEEFYRRRRHELAMNALKRQASRVE